MLFGPRVRHIDVQELSRELDNRALVIIDVREPYEFAAGHVPSATNMPLGTLPTAAAGLERDSKIVVICQSGHRSVTAAKRLLKAGFTDIRNVRGGTGAWQGKLER